MPLTLPFDTTYLDLPDHFYTRQTAEPASDPQLIVFNHALAATLGLKTGDMTGTEAAAIFSGNETLKGSTPFAQVYAGHQFGGFSPQLGDGRALHLGEVTGPAGRFDIQLKGAGRTPYSRSGDGRAWVGPVLREYVMSCAMDALGVPTTKALAAVTTGDRVLREQGPLPGAILTRVASSHIRVGTFQYFAAQDDVPNLERLFEYTRARHYPAAQSPSDLLAAAVDAQARLVAKWMSLGFIHGVMNTDNAHVAGITIDYGPCAFMDGFHPMKVFSSIDQTGRYAYSNQPNIAAWNMAQFATAMLPLMPDRDAAIREFTDIIEGFGLAFSKAYAAEFAQKLGLSEDQSSLLAPTSENTNSPLSQLLQIMTDLSADFTLSFWGLAQGEFETLQEHPDFATWQALWRDLEPNDALMARTNPAIIPRNHRIEEAIQAGVAGDYAPFHRLNAALNAPFSATDPDLMSPPKINEEVKQTFCGT